MPIWHMRHLGFQSPSQCSRTGALGSVSSSPRQATSWGPPDLPVNAMILGSTSLMVFFRALRSPDKEWSGQMLKEGWRGQWLEKQNQKQLPKCSWVILGLKYLCSKVQSISVNLASGSSKTWWQIVLTEKHSEFLGKKLLHWMGPETGHYSFRPSSPLS